MKRPSKFQPVTTRRRRHGNMLVLVVAVTATVLVALLYFCFKMIREMGGYAEQRTSIEAAALAAANDIGKIYYKDANGVYYGLSDSPPLGTNPLAGDGYPVSVIGINTLQATVRLDLALADMFDDRIWQQRAVEDYAKIANIRTQLVSQITSAAAGGTFRDINGNFVDTVADATLAYRQNVHNRMAGASQTDMVAGSLTITPGCLPNTPGNIQSISCTPVPQNAPPLAAVSTNYELNNYYAANLDIPYTSSTNPWQKVFPFVFSGGGNGGTGTGVGGGGTMLVDTLDFQTTAPGVAANLFIPSVLKVSAQQSYVDKDEHGRPFNRTVQISCASSIASTFNTSQLSSGALTFSFPNGVPPEITSLTFMYQDPNHIINWSPCDVLKTVQSNNLDFPEAPLHPPPTTLANWNTNFNLAGPKGSYFPNDGGLSQTHPRIVYPLSLALYDWIRRGGPLVNAQDLVNWFNTTGFPGGTNANTTPTIYEYMFTPTATSGAWTSQINKYVISGASVPQILPRRVSENQWVAEAGGAMYSGINGIYYDLEIKDNVYNEGTITGGWHAGEPLGNQIPVPGGINGTFNAAGGPACALANSGHSTDMAAPTGGEYAANGGNRAQPTPQLALAVDIRFRESGYPWNNPTQTGGIPGNSTYPTTPVPCPFPP